MHCEARCIIGITPIFVPLIREIEDLNETLTLNRITEGWKQRIDPAIASIAPCRSAEPGPSAWLVTISKNASVLTPSATTTLA
ncbi:hypothetical protein N9506_01075 [Pseudomonadales bacterium]|nr:hypothetical protein [Pseudomonadales bacterium]